MGSSLGTLLATVALVVDVKDRTNSGPWVGALMFVEFLPAVAVGGFFAPFLHPLPRPGGMVVSGLGRLRGFFPLSLSSPGRPNRALARLARLSTGLFPPALHP